MNDTLRLYYTGCNGPFFGSRGVTTCNSAFAPPPPRPVLSGSFSISKTQMEHGTSAKRTKDMVGIYAMMMPCIRGG